MKPHQGPYGESYPFPEPSFTCPLIKTKSHLSVKVPSKGLPPPPPPPCSQSRAPMEEDASVSTANVWFIHLYLSACPVKELSSDIGGRHMVTIHEMPWMHRYRDNKMTWILIATVHHITSGVRPTKFQTAWFLCTECTYVHIYVSIYTCTQTYTHTS